MNPAPDDPGSIEALAAALQRSEAQYRSLVDSMDLGYILVEVIVDESDRVIDLRYVDANAKAVAMTGAELVGRTTRELSPDFEPHWFETFGRVARTGVVERHELSAAPLQVWYDFCVFKVGSPETRQVVALYQDISLRKLADAALRESEAELRRAHDELESRVFERTAELARSNAALEGELRERRAAEAQIKALFAQLVTAQETERQRIAMDIHDQLGQQMTALRLHLEALSSRRDAPDLPTAVGRARMLADELDQSVDFITWHLRPAALDHLGLSDALQQLVTSWSERFRISAAYETSGTLAERFRGDVEANLYRIAQEALHNVYKHARAKHVHVRLEHREELSMLTISDDGCGFCVPGDGRPATRTGLGLINMRERATLAGGNLEIHSTAGGTAVTVIRRAAAA